MDCAHVGRVHALTKNASINAKQTKRRGISSLLVATSLAISLQYDFSEVHCHRLAWLGSQPQRISRI